MPTRVLLQPPRTGSGGGLAGPLLPAVDGPHATDVLVRHDAPHATDTAKGAESQGGQAGIVEVRVAPGLDDRVETCGTAGLDELGGAEPRDGRERTTVEREIDDVARSFDHERFGG